MKKLFTTLSILAVIMMTADSFAATYYSKGSSPINIVTNWSLTTDGLGASPAAGFPGDGNEYIVQSGHSMTTSATVNFGTNSTLKVLDGATLTIGHIVTVINFTVENNGIYVHNAGGAGTVFPGTTGVITLGATSTVEIKSHVLASTLPSTIWGNLIINISLGGEWVMNDQSSFETKGNLIIRKTGSVATRTVRLSPNTGAFNLNAVIGGNLLIEGGVFTVSANNDGNNNNGTYNLTVKGDVIVKEKGTSGFNVSEFRVASANARNTSFALNVEGNVLVDENGVFAGSGVATNTTANINIDITGNLNVGATGTFILSKAATVGGTIKAISTVIGGNLEVTTGGVFTGTAGAPWTDDFGGATVYFKGGGVNSSFKMASGQGIERIAYIVAKNKVLTLESNLVTDKFLAVAGVVSENGHTITGTINTLTNLPIPFNGDIAADTQSKITLQDGATVTSLGLMPGMELTSIAGNVLAPNTIITQIIDENNITISRAALNGATAYLGVGVDPANFNIETNAGTLPLKLLAFTAARNLTGVKLQWKTAQEKNVAQIVVERSINAAAFNVITAMNAYNTESQQTYSYLDRTAPSFGYVYYRLKIIDNDGSVAYSAITVVNSLALTSNDGLKIYPNPVTDYLNVSYPVAIGSGNLKVLSTDGKLILKKTIEKGQEVNKINVSSLKQGIYIVVYQTTSGQVYTSKFVK